MNPLQGDTAAMWDRKITRSSRNASGLVAAITTRIAAPNTYDYACSSTNTANPRASGSEERDSVEGHDDETTHDQQDTDDDREGDCAA